MREDSLWSTTREETGICGLLDLRWGRHCCSWWWGWWWEESEGAVLAGLKRPVCREMGRKLSWLERENGGCGREVVCREDEVVAKGRRKREHRLEGGGDFAWRRWKIGFLGFLCCPRFFVSKLPPLFCVLETHIYKQSIVWSLNMVTLLFFFCKFWFFLFFLFWNFFKNEQYQRRLNEKNKWFYKWRVKSRTHSKDLWKFKFVLRRRWKC